MAQKRRSKGDHNNRLVGCLDFMRCIQILVYKVYAISNGTAYRDFAPCREGGGGRLKSVLRVSAKTA